MPAVAKWWALPIPCRCHLGSLCFGRELNTTAFPNSCLPRWHMGGLSGNALFALWHSTEFCERAVTYQNQGWSWIQSLREHLKHLGSCVTTREEGIETHPRLSVCVKAANDVKEMRFCHSPPTVLKLCKMTSQNTSINCGTKHVRGFCLRIFELYRRIETWIWIEPWIWCVVTNPTVKRPTQQPFRQPRALYIVARSAFTLFTSHSEITDGERGSARLFVRMAKLQVIKPNRLAAPEGYACF